MLIVTRLLIASVIGLGLANSVLASPIAIDLVHSNSENIAESVASQSNFLQAEMNISLVSSPIGAQNNHLNVENVKQKPGKISKVAEPSSLILLGFGLLGLGFLRRRKH